MGYVTKWLIIEEFSIFLNHRILSEKWVGMLRIIQRTNGGPVLEVSAINSFT